MKKLFVTMILTLILGASIGACTHHVKIEPSDKPFVVNLNVKIDHEVRLQIKEENQDLLNLEDEVLSDKSKNKTKS